MTFCHVGESAAVVEVKVGDDDAFDEAGEGLALVVCVDKRPLDSNPSDRVQ